MAHLTWLEPYTQRIHHTVEVFTKRNLSSGALNPPAALQGPAVLIRGDNAPPLTAGPHIELGRVTGQELWQPVAARGDEVLLSFNKL